MMHRTFTRIFIFLLLGLLVGGACSLSSVFAQESPTENDTRLVDLGRAMEDAIIAEKANVVRYKNQLNRFQREKIYLTAGINGYQAQLSTYGNLLLASGVDITSIQKAWTELKASMVELQKTMDEMKPRLEEIAGEIGNINQQKVLAENQIAELQKIGLKDEAILSLRNRAKELFKVLGEKEKLIAQLRQAISDDLEHLNQIRESFSMLSAKFESALAQRKKQHLFERQKTPLSVEALVVLAKEAERLVNQARILVRPGFWIEKVRELWKNTGLVLISLGLGFIVALIRGLFFTLNMGRPGAPANAHAGSDSQEGLCRPHQWIPAVFSRSSILPPKYMCRADRGACASWRFALPSSCSCAARWAARPGRTVRCR